MTSGRFGGGGGGAWGGHLPLLPTPGSGPESFLSEVMKRVELQFFAKSTKATDNLP